MAAGQLGEGGVLGQGGPLGHQLSEGHEALLAPSVGVEGGHSFEHG